MHLLNETSNGLQMHYNELQPFHAANFQRNSIPKKNPIKTSLNSINIKYHSISIDFIFIAFLPTTSYTYWENHISYKYIKINHRYCTNLRIVWSLERNIDLKFNFFFLHVSACIKYRRKIIFPVPSYRWFSICTKIDEKKVDSKIYEYMIKMNAHK